MIPLQISHLVKRYKVDGGQFFEAVSDVSFEVREGECFGLLGPNGAGKSTTIHCITGFYPPSSGSVFLNGIDMAQNPKAAKRLLGVCSQEETLDSDFRVIDQLIRYAAFYRMPADQARTRAKDLIERFMLTDKTNDEIEALSGGMRRKLQVARALMPSPKILVLDEPTTGLDPEARRVVWDVVSEHRRNGGAVLLSTHYMDEAERLCDRIAVICKGKLLDIDSPRRLIEKYIGTAQVEEEVRPGVVWKRAPNLEDVYLKITGSKLGNSAGENHVPHS